jgi:hypothetical protein
MFRFDARLLPGAALQVGELVVLTYALYALLPAARRKGYVLDPRALKASRFFPAIRALRWH